MYSPAACSSVVESPGIRTRNLIREEFEGPSEIETMHSKFTVPVTLKAEIGTETFPSEDASILQRLAEFASFPIELRIVAFGVGRPTPTQKTVMFSSGERGSKGCKSSKVRLSPFHSA